MQLLKEFQRILAGLKNKAKTLLVFVLRTVNMDLKETYLQETFLNDLCF